MPLAEVLAQELPDAGLVLEIASGTGEHAVFMAQRFPSLNWQPTDCETSALESIAAWAESAGLQNLLPPLQIDAQSADWPVASADAIVCINMVHISPWSATVGLFEGAARLLREDMPLVLYGPYLEDYVETAPSNLAFDEDLKRRDREWGLRQIAMMDDLAGRDGFVRTARHPMPANNLTLVYRRE